MNVVELCEVEDIVQGGKLKVSGKNFILECYPAFGAGGLNGYVEIAEYNRDAIVLSSIGARCGKCFLVEDKWTSLANTQIILPDEEKVHVRFLWYQLNDESRWPRSGVAQPFIRPADVKTHKIVLPPLDEQKRIAAILDKADEVRRLRQRAIDSLNQLRQSIYYEMFVNNQSSDWPPVTIGNVVKDARTGPFGSQLLHSEFVEDGIPVLGIDNVVSNKFVWAKPRYITLEKFKELNRYTVRAGDVLITIMGTCGRCAIVPKGIQTAINTKHLCCLTPNPEQIRSEFLKATFLMHPDVLSQLGLEAKGAVMPGLNMGIIKGLQIRLPDISLQGKFVKRVRVLDSLEDKKISSGHHLKMLFASLQQKAFHGEL